jgi:hypothetical protein
MWTLRRERKSNESANRFHGNLCDLGIHVPRVTGAHRSGDLGRVALLGEGLVIESFYLTIAGHMLRMGSMGKKKVRLSAADKQSARHVLYERGVLHPTELDIEHEARKRKTTRPKTFTDGCAELGVMGVTPQEEAKRDVEKANEWLELRAKRLTEGDFKDAVWTAPEGVGLAQMARKLSRQWDNIEFVLSFARGIEAIFARPTFKPFDVSPHNRQCANEAAQRGLWPSRVEVRAFCQGYASASADRQKIEDLERENARLEKKLATVMCGGGFGVGPFGF